MEGVIIMPAGPASGSGLLHLRSSSFRKGWFQALAGSVTVLLFLFFFPALQGCSRDHPGGTSPERVGEEAKRVFLEPVVCGEGGDPYEAENSCLACHKGIEAIRCPDSDMFRQIVRRAEDGDTRNRCVICHGGNPTVIPEPGLNPKSEAYRDYTQKAHTGTVPFFLSHPGPKTFYPDPGSPWINANTCGTCHEWEVRAQWKSLMMTEAGKIQGTAWGFGGLTGYEHKWANYEVQNDSDPDAVLGTETFRDYLDRLAKTESNVFPDRMGPVPPAPRGGADVTENPSLSAFTYLRGECQRCHLAVGGKQRYGDYRGRGCSACHMPYSNAGTYQGKDPAVPREEGGHPLVHSIQSSYWTPVKTGKVTYSGIPVESCNACHNRGRRIGVSFQGLMETPYHSPWTKTGAPQQPLHGKHYLKLQEDLHNEKGFFCQDCHTSLDVHSPNRLIGSIPGAVEIECFDCHGTPEKYPWELPLGFGDEYREEPMTGRERGLATELPAFLSKAKTYDPEDGYLLSARGNPLGNVVRTGDRVKVYLASGEVKELTPLKEQARNDVFSLKGRVSMVQVKKHINRLECYGCHTTWAPQCYGCHIKVDYGKPGALLDWVAMGHNARPDGLTPEYTEEEEAYRLNGDVEETRSYLRWEDPALAQNGEGRVSPVVPGCQTTVTVLNDAGEVVLSNHIFRIKNVEGAGEEGQLGLDMSPLHPHTVQKSARGCESCHANPKALGYGISGGRLFKDPAVDHDVDLATGPGEIIPEGVAPQTAAIPGLAGDWSRFVTEAGRQIQTVGHHFRLSRPLNNEERAHMEREGVCLSCHQEIPDRSLSVVLLHPLAKLLGMFPTTNPQHTSLLHKTLLLAGWVQVCVMLGGTVFGIAAVIAFLVWRRKKRREKLAM